MRSDLVGNRILAFFPLILLVVLGPAATAATYLVNPDGSGDFATIQDAVYGADDGDTILLGDGRFTGEGNRNVSINNKVLTIRSQSSDASACIIDPEGGPDLIQRAFRITGTETDFALIEDITFTGATALGSGVHGHGGAITILYGATCRIERCLFISNQAGSGGGLCVRDSSIVRLSTCTFAENIAVSRGGAAFLFTNDSVVIEDCTIYGNTSGVTGGAFDIWEYCVPSIVNCTFDANGAPSGGTIWNRSLGLPAIVNSIIANSIEGVAVGNEDPESFPGFLCCNIHGNAGGDWVGIIEGFLGIYGNISLPPHFCGDNNPDEPYTLHSNSPCAPDYNPECGQIGAWPVGCGDAPITYIVYPDGSGDFPTIQEAVTAASDGDTILLGDGVFTGEDNRNIVSYQKSLTVRSLSGNRSACIIDPEREPDLVRRGFEISGPESTNFLIADLTVTGAGGLGGGVNGHGGGVLVKNGATCSVMNCVFSDNEANRGAGICTRDSASVTVSGCTFADNAVISFGGGVFLRGSGWGVVTNCTFDGNSSAYSGGAIEIWEECAATIINCTLDANTAPNGGGVLCRYDAAPVFYNTIITHSTEGSAVYCPGSGNSPTFFCCDIFGNAGGDWIDRIEDQYGINGNISLPPYFCNSNNPDEPFTLHSVSPCAPDYNPECGLIGAWPVGCEEVSGISPDRGRAMRCSLYRPAPNPFARRTEISYQLAEREIVNLSVVDVAGRVVRVLKNNIPNEPGDHLVVWNGRDDAGYRLPSGVYFFCLQIAGESLTRQVLLMH